MRSCFDIAWSVLAAIGVSFASVGCSSELTQAQAISLAKTASAKECAEATPCTYDARREGTRWYVHVQFTKRNSPDEPALPYPGGHETIVVDDHGKIVETMPGEWSGA
jgi:hypothetical protein